MVNGFPDCYLKAASNFGLLQNTTVQLNYAQFIQQYYVEIRTFVARLHGSLLDTVKHYERTPYPHCYLPPAAQS